MLILLPGHQLNLVWLVWGQGHTKVKVIPRSNCKCLAFYWQAGGGPLTERHSCVFLSFGTRDNYKCKDYILFQLLTNEAGKFWIPSIFVTNAGNVMRHQKARQLSEWLGVEVKILFHDLEKKLQAFYLFNANYPKIPLKSK